MGNPTKPWKVMKVTCNAEIYQRADLLKTWLEAVTPQVTYALFLRDNMPVIGDARPTRGDGTICVAFVLNGVAKWYARYYNKIMENPRLDWGNSYYASIEAGDVYTVMYQE